MTRLHLALPRINWCFELGQPLWVISGLTWPRIRFGYRQFSNSVIVFRESHWRLESTVSRQSWSITAVSLGQERVFNFVIWTDFTAILYYIIFVHTVVFIQCVQRFEPHTCKSQLLLLLLLLLVFLCLRAHFCGNIRKTSFSVVAARPDDLSTAKLNYHYHHHRRRRKTSARWN